MIKLGEWQDLKINNTSSIGVFLDADTDDYKDNILLPNNQLGDKQYKDGDIINVFIYNDSQDRLIATFKAPYITIGEIEKLTVVDKNSHGAFLDWGLEKDLFLPKNQQVCDVEIGKEYLVSLYIDKKNRLAATMDIYSNLEIYPTEVKAGDFLNGTVYKVKDDIGAFIAIEDLFFGLVPSTEIFEPIKVGDNLSLRILKVREDGKIDLSPQKLKHLQIDDNSDKIIKIMIEKNIISINEKWDPEKIKKNFNMSKKAFKRAIGRLYKEKKLVKDNNDEFKIKS